MLNRKQNLEVIADLGAHCCRSEIRFLVFCPALSLLKGRLSMQHKSFVPILSSFAYLNLLSMRIFHQLWKYSYNCIRSFVGNVVCQKSLVHMIWAPGCIFCDLYENTALFASLALAVTACIQSAKSFQAVLQVSYWWRWKWEWRYYIQLMVWFCFVQDLFTVRFYFSCKFKIKCFNSSERKNFSSFYSSICLADCCVWMQIIWRFLSIFGIFSGLGCWGHSFTYTSTRFARPLHCPDPEAGMIVKGLCGEPVQRNGKR